MSFDFNQIINIWVNNPGSWINSLIKSIFNVTVGNEVGAVIALIILIGILALWEPWKKDK